MNNERDPYQYARELAAGQIIGLGLIAALYTASMMQQVRRECELTALVVEKQQQNDSTSAESEELSWSCQTILAPGRGVDGLMQGVAAFALHPFESSNLAPGAAGSSGR